MEFVLIIIVVVIVSVISAAMKKKTKSSGEQDAPARSTMADIQRAFMMAAGMPGDEQNQPPRPAPPYVHPAAGSYIPPSTPPPLPYSAPVAPYVQAESQLDAPMSDLSSGLSDGMGSKPIAGRLTSPFANTQISSYFMDENAEEQISQAQPVDQQPPAGTGIPLFEDQRDIVKALIYSEILPRRSSAQHRR